MIPGALTDRNIALLGFMTAGKSRVGALLAARTGLPFRDIDALIEGLEQAPIHKIFQQQGEVYFRRIEARVLAELCRGAGQIIGCGGGTVLLAENRQVLMSRCLPVWLRVSIPQVMSRLAEPGSPRRPLLEGQDPLLIVGDLMAQRESTYAETVRGVPDGLAIDTDGREPEAVAEEILLRLGLRN